MIPAHHKGIKNRIFWRYLFHAIVSFFFLSILIAYGQTTWSNPTGQPPTKNIANPLTPAKAGQAKAGGLLLNISALPGAGSSYGLIVLGDDPKGRVGIGNVDRFVSGIRAKLELLGNFRITGLILPDGQQGLVGQILERTGNDNMIWSNQYQWLTLVSDSIWRGQVCEPGKICPDGALCPKEGICLKKPAPPPNIPCTPNTNSCPRGELCPSTRICGPPVGGCGDGGIGINEVCDPPGSPCIDPNGFGGICSQSCSRCLPTVLARPCALQTFLGGLYKACGGDCPLLGETCGADAGGGGCSCKPVGGGYCRFDRILNECVGGCDDPKETCQLLGTQGCSCRLPSGGGGKLPGAEENLALAKEIGISLGKELISRSRAQTGLNCTGLVKPDCTKLTGGWKNHDVVCAEVSPGAVAWVRACYKDK